MTARPRRCPASPLPEQSPLTAASVDAAARCEWLVGQLGDAGEHAVPLGWLERGLLEVATEKLEGAADPDRLRQHVAVGVVEPDRLVQARVRVTGR